MNESLLQIVPWVLKASLLMACAWIVVQLSLRWIKPKSPITHRLAWTVVLAQGILIVQMPIEVPYFVEQQPASSLSEADDPFALENLDVLESSAASGAPATPSTNLLSPSPNVDPRSSSWNWEAILVAVWMGGIVVVLTRMGWQYRQLLIRVSTARPAEGLWQEEWVRLQRRARIERPIPLLIHANMGPLLCRLPMRTCVVVPERLWSSFSRSQRTAILRHELAHYQRHDIWKSLLMRMIALPHWFNPFAWMAIKRFDETGEWACDEELVRQCPSQVPAYAQALLAVAKPATQAVATSSAGGSSLGIRVRRMLSIRTQEDSLVKRMVLFGILILSVTLGLIRVQLVARETSAPPVRPAIQDEEFSENAQRLAERIDTTASDLMKQFAAALKTDAGQIVLQERAAGLANEMREQAEQGALKEFLEEHFEANNEGYRLRPDSNLPSKLMPVAETFNKDLEAMKPVLAEIADEVTEDGEINRLVARFLRDDAAATMIYVRELRRRLRPDVSLIRERFGEVFVMGEDGVTRARSSRRDHAEKMLQHVTAMKNQSTQLRRDLGEWSADIVDDDGFHTQIKELLQQNRFVSFLTVEILDERPQEADTRIDEFFEHLEHVFHDTADGLAIREEAKGEFQEFVQEFNRVSNSVSRMRVAINEFADSLDRDNELERGWSEMLRTDIAVMLVAREIDFAAGSPAEAVRDLLGEILQENDAGKLEVARENPEEVAEFIRDNFRAFRQARRKGRVVDEIADKLDDREFGELIKSSGGKFVIAQMIRQSLLAHQTDGLAMWVDAVFEEADAGLVLKEDTREEIEYFMADVAAVNEELAKDDF